MKIAPTLVAFSLFFTVYAHPGASRKDVCNSGRAQSPINLSVKYSADSDKIPRMEPKISALQYFNGAGNFEIRCADKHGDCGSLTFSDKKKYDLQQLHLHAPSEHSINGRRFPLEMHFVHSNRTGALAVFGVLFEEGKHNEELQYVLDVAEKRGYTAVHLPELSGADKADTCVLDGSLTTPPCTEGVRWVISTKIEQASRKQIRQYSQLVGEKDNARPVQPLNGRNVKCYRKIKDDDSSSSDEESN